MASSKDYKHGMSEQKRICGLMNNYFLRHGYQLCAAETDSITDMNNKIDIIITNAMGEVKEQFDIKSTTNDKKITYTFKDKTGKTSLVYNSDYSVKVAFVFNNSSVLYVADPDRLNRLTHNPKCVNKGLTFVSKRIGGSIEHCDIMVNDSNVDAWDYYKCEQIGDDVYATVNGKKVLCKMINMNGLTKYAFENGSEYINLSKEYLETYVCGGKGKVIDLSL